MNKQFGNAALTVILAIFLLIATFSAVAGLSYVSAYNYGNEAEQTIKAAHKNNKNILGQYSLKVKEAARVGEKYSDAITEFVANSMQGRYGENGSKAQWQWIQEKIPTFDSSMFAKIQQIIESGRNEYQVAQTQLADMCRVYETNLGYLWKGMWLRLAGYPKLDLDKMCTLVTSAHAEKAYETGVDNGVDF